MASVAQKKNALVMAVTVTVAATAFAACEEQRRLPDYVAVSLNDTKMRHPIGFEDRREVLHIGIPPRAGGLSNNQLADVQRFLARYKAEAVGRLSASVSGEARGNSGAMRAQDDIARLLREAEIKPADVVKGRHSDPHRSRSMVRLSYARPVAVAPECGHWHRDMGRDRERIHYPEFGCATQRNLAGMVANARDLQRPQDEQPRSAERRTQVWSRYIAAEPTENALETKAKAVDTSKK